MRRIALAVALLSWCAPVQAQDSCVVRGRLLGCDGRPMRAVTGGFYRISGERMPRRPFGADGAFEVHLPSPGTYQAFFGGVHHRTLAFPLHVEGRDTVGLTLRLASAALAASFDSVRVIGSFNDWAHESAVPMAPQGDGTYAAEVPCDRDTLWYQLLGAHAGPTEMCGTAADSFVVDRRQPWSEGESNSFAAVLRAGRRPVRVVFDPAALPRCPEGPVIAFADTNGPAARFDAARRAVEGWQQRLDDAHARHLAAGGAPDSFRFDMGPAVDELFGRAERGTDPMLRDYLRLSALGIAGWAVDSARAATLARTLAPDSPAWSLLGAWRAPGIFMNLASAARLPENGRELAERIAAAHPDTSIRASFLYGLLYQASTDGEEARANGYYARLVGEAPGTEFADMARKQFSPDRAVKPGKPCPAFVVKALDDTTVAYRPVRFRGHYVLIDFWATWCGPCVAEMKNLEKAWADYGRRGLRILSVSFDEQRAAVRKFRGERSAMPWLHAFEPLGFDGPAARAFEVVSIPRAVLVDPRGRITACDNDLRGDRLARTLGRVLGPGTGAAASR